MQDKRYATYALTLKNTMFCARGAHAANAQDQRKASDYHLTVWLLTTQFRSLHEHLHERFWEAPDTRDISPTNYVRISHFSDK